MIGVAPPCETFCDLFLGIGGVLEVLAPVGAIVVAAAFVVFVYVVFSGFCGS